MFAVTIQYWKEELRSPGPKEQVPARIINYEYFHLLNFQM